MSGFLASGYPYLVDLEDKHTDEELWNALERVGLKEAVTELPEKLDSIVEDGGSLSRGQVRSMHRCYYYHYRRTDYIQQKQLMCLARGLLRGPKIVVLDEATSRLVVAIIHRNLRSLHCYPPAWTS